MYARHVPRRGAPAGTRDRDRRSITEGRLLVIQAAWSRPGNLLGSHLSQASQRVSRGVLEGDAKPGWQRVRMGHPTPYRYGYARSAAIDEVGVIGVGNGGMLIFRRTLQGLAILQIHEHQQ